MGYAVFHLQKGSAPAGSLGHHIDRTEGKEKCYKHADPNRKNLNQEFAKAWKNIPLQEAINQNIKKHYKGKKEIRKDAVRYISHILTGSHEDMIRIFSKKDTANQWITENAKFIKDNFGVKNIVRFTLHLDEKTPHIHCVTTAITEDGRLSAKELVGNNKRLEELQNDYANRMKTFDLKRGLKSNVKHVDTKEFYKLLENGLPKEEIKINFKSKVERKSINVNFGAKIAQILDEKEISPFGIKKAKEELKTEISELVQKTFTEAKNILRNEIVKEALEGYNELTNTIASDTALLAQEQKKQLDKIRFKEWEKNKDKYKSPEQEENKVLNRFK